MEAKAMNPGLVQVISVYVGQYEYINSKKVDTSGDVFFRLTWDSEEALAAVSVETAKNQIQYMLQVLNLTCEKYDFYVCRETGSNCSWSILPVHKELKGGIEKTRESLDEISQFVFGAGTQCHRMSDTWRAMNLPVNWDSAILMVAYREWAYFMVRRPACLMSAWAYIMSGRAFK